MLIVERKKKINNFGEIKKKPLPINCRHILPLSSVEKRIALAAIAKAELGFLAESAGKRAKFCQSYVVGIFSTLHHTFFFVSL